MEQNQQKLMGEDQYGIQGAYVILAIAFGLSILSKPFYSYLLRRRLMDLGLWNEQTHQQLAQEPQAASDMLKWGLILLFFGIGLIVSERINPPFYTTTLGYGIIAVFTAIGFLIYYGLYVLITRKKQ